MVNFPLFIFLKGLIRQERQIDGGANSGSRLGHEGESIGGLAKWRTIPEKSQYVWHLKAGLTIMPSGMWKCQSSKDKSCSRLR